MPYPRKTDGELYLDALSVARKWLWIAAERADKLDQLDHAEQLANVGQEVGDLLEKHMRTGPLRRALKTRTAAEQAAADRRRDEAAQRAKARTGSAYLRPARDGGRPRRRDKSA